MVGKACVWKASGLVAVTDRTGRLFHKGIVRGKENLYALVFVAMWWSLRIDYYIIINEKMSPQYVDEKKHFFNTQVTPIFTNSEYSSSLSHKIVHWNRRMFLW